MEREGGYGDNGGADDADGDGDDDGDPEGEDQGVSITRRRRRRRRGFMWIRKTWIRRGMLVKAPMVTRRMMIMIEGHPFLGVPLNTRLHG